MRIDFGWSFDGAPPTELKLGHEVAGPQRLLQILATRLGLTRLEVGSFNRQMAACRALQQLYASRSLFGADIYAKDPWNFARIVLQWRDELVAAGWEGSIHSEAGDREKLIHAFEDQLHRQSESSGLPYHGDADLFRDVYTTLQALPKTWELGIEEVRIYHSEDSIPTRYREIFSHLPSVYISADATPSNDPTVIVHRPHSVWEGAELTTQLIYQSKDKYTLLVGDEAEVLNTELRKINKSVPLPGSAAHRGASTLLPLYLEAFLGEDINVAATVDLLHTSIRQEGRKTIAVVDDWFIRRRLVKVLARTSSTTSEEWKDIAESEAAKDFCDHLVSSRIPITMGDDGSDSVAVEDVERALEFFPIKRVREGFSAAIRPFETLSVQLLHQIALDYVPEYVSPLSVQTMADVVFSPAHCRSASNVIWWNPAQAGEQGRRRSWSEEEQHRLGVEVIQRDVNEQLELESNLSVLKGLDRIEVIAPHTHIDSEYSVDNQLVTLLGISSDGDHEDSEVRQLAMDDDGKGVASEPFEGEASGESSYSEPLCVKHGERLIPETISFTQLDLLLWDPLQWVLKYRLWIKPSPSLDIRTPHLAHGDVIHRAFEILINDFSTKELVPTEQDIQNAFEVAVEQMYPLLLEQGYALEREKLQLQTVRSWKTFNEIVEACGATIVGSEVDIDPGICVPDTDIELVGSRDVQVRWADGSLGVVDLKDSNSSRYEKWVKDNTSLQLAIYAYTLAEKSQQKVIPTAYYLLKKQKFLTTAAAFQSPGGLPLNVLEPSKDNELSQLDKARQYFSAVVEVLDQFRAGEVHRPQSVIAELLFNGEKPSSAKEKAIGFWGVKDSEGTTIDTHAYNVLGVITGAEGDFF